MGQKDIAEKNLTELNDVFADIVNVLLFDGRTLMSEDALTEADPHSNYLSDGRMFDQERDVTKYWDRSMIRIAKVGFENETADEPDMPLRVMSYDAADYRRQFSPKNRDRRFPVVTMVLYFGYQHHWSAARTLYESVDIPKKLRPYVNDYRLNLFEVAYLDDDKVAMFKSDFRLVADYFVQMRKTGHYRPPTEEIRHVSELLHLMAELAGDDRFEEVEEALVAKGREERVTMCTVLDEVETRGRLEGKLEGKLEGEKLLGSLIKKLIAAGRTEDVERVCEDPEYRGEMYSEFGIA